ncbi:MAG: cytochrome c [Caldilineae bacterium]|nr:MAG: cytochrome c [Caldilineae bacterium]
MKKHGLSFGATSLITLALLLVTLLFSACGDQPIAPMATAPPPDTPTPASTINVSAPDLSRGRQVYLDKQCAICHGDLGQGGVAPPIAGLTTPFESFLHIQRTAIPPKPRFNRSELTDQDAYNIYAWLQSVDLQEADVASRVEIELAEGEILGMSVWTTHGCDKCHGAFAQGSANAPALAELSFPFEMERAKMRQTGDEIPEHRAEYIRDDILRRLYKWLQEGAHPLGGC